MFKLLLSFLLTACLSACDLFHTDFNDEEPAKLYQAKLLSDQSTPIMPIRVMNWNIKFAGARLDFFFDCLGDEVLMPKAIVLANLKQIADAINNISPDILLAQEVDVLSKRSAYVDQVQWILDHTDLNYAAYASQWKADFIPSDGVGRVNSGNVIFSRWPIIQATRYALAPISDQDALTRYFYLKRNYIDAVIKPTGATSIHVVNIHTTAYAQDNTQKKQLDQLLNALIELDNQAQTFIAGGDFNQLPAGSSQTSAFADNVCKDEYVADDFSTQTTWLDGFYANFSPAISLTDYQLDNTLYFTHSVDKNVFWNRKIDYLFTNTNFEAASTQVYQNMANGGLQTMNLSDHAPMAASWSWP